MRAILLISGTILLLAGVYLFIYAHDYRDRNLQAVGPLGYSQGYLDEQDDLNEARRIKDQMELVDSIEKRSDRIAFSGIGLGIIGIALIALGAIYSTRLWDRLTGRRKRFPVLSVEHDPDR